MNESHHNHVPCHEGQATAHALTPAEEPLPVVTWEMITHWLDFSPDAALVVDPAGMIVLLNGPAAALFGYALDELVHHPLEGLLPQHLHGAHAVQRTHYMRAPRTRPMGTGLNLLGQRKDGSTFPVDISLRPFVLEQIPYVLGTIRDMTAQRQAAQEHAHLTKRLQIQDHLINLSHDAIWVRDPHGRILSWNRGAEHLYGWNEREATGQVSHLLLSTHFPRSRERLDQCLSQEGHWDGDLIHQHRDGQQVIVESRQVVMRDEAGQSTAILEIDRDVTERRRLEQMEQEVRAEVKARLDVLQLILDRLPTGVFLVQGPGARLILANRAAIELWGAEWEPGQSMEDFTTHHQIRVWTDQGQPLPERSVAGQALARGAAVLGAQLVIRRADGTSLPVLADAIPLDLLHTCRRLPLEMAKVLASSERVVLVVYQDVSALKAAEALKDEFISLATHELRTPVTVLAGYADLLLRGARRGAGHALDEQQQHKVQAMKEAAQDLTKLTEDLLDVTRLQAGRFSLQRQPTDLVGLTRRVLEQLQATTPRHQLSLETTCPSLQAAVDAFRLEQVLSNLLTNAIKYSPAGGPIAITIWQDAQAQEARFSVRDSGMGIPSTQQARLFGRFVRADNAQEARIRGTGLGLYLCRELVERHGGRIWFQSEEHVGSTFFFTLPLAEGAE